MKQPRDDSARRPLQCFCPFELRLDDFTQPSGEREVSALAVFGFARVQSQPSAAFIGMMFLPREYLIMDAPPGDVCRLNGRLYARRTSISKVRAMRRGKD